MRKRICCSILTALLSVILMGSLVQAGASFTDVNSDHWAYSSIMQMVGRGILEGNGDGTFSPEASVTREQFAKILVASLGLPLENPQTGTFSDISKSDWSYQYVETAKEYLTGYSENGKMYYRGTENAVREDMAVAMVFAKGLQNQNSDLSVLNSYADKDKISQDVKNYVAIAIKNKLMVGDAGYFYAQDTLTRAEACELMYKAGLVAKTGVNVYADDLAAKAPIASLPSGTYTDLISVKFAGQGSNIIGYLYTLDGSEPTNMSAFWSGNSINIEKNTILRVRTQYSSNGTTKLGLVATYKYSIAGPITTVKPKIISTSPSNGGTNVGVQPTIKLTFSEPVKPDAMFYTQVYLYNVDGSLAATGNCEDEYYGAYNIEIPVKLYRTLNANTEYTVKISNKYKNSKDIDNEPYTFKFTTAATTNISAPTVISTTPANGATNASLNPTITLTFSEPVKALGESFANVNVFTAIGQPLVPGKCISANYTALSNVMTIRFIYDVTLEPNSKYTVMVSKSFVNNTGVQNEPYTFSFTTAAATTNISSAPTVVSTTPANGAINVSRNPTIDLTFSEPVMALVGAFMNVYIFNTSGTYSLIGGQCLGLNYTKLSRVMTISLVNGETLEPNTKYRVEVTNHFVDINGIESEPYTFEFTTGQ